MKFSSDIDIDVASRDQALAVIQHTAASIIRDGKNTKHNTGVYFTDIPCDPFIGRASLDYETAEQLGYIKVDVLNVGLYQQVQSEQHLQELMYKEPEWDRLSVNSIARLAMFLAVIRPAKRHLIGRSWREVAETIWDRPADGAYFFKKSHSVGYAHLVAVNMNLLSQASEQE